MAKKVVEKSNMGAGLAVMATIAAAAGAYFVYGTKEGAKTKKKVKSWALKAKGEVLEKIEKMKDISEESYNTTVSTVMQKYEKMRAEHGDELDIVAKELKGYWSHLKKHMNPAKKVAKKTK
jgi:DNA polymerase III gamma/tau subunit